jgi:hypothetical protein
MALISVASNLCINGTREIPICNHLSDGPVQGLKTRVKTESTKLQCSPYFPKHANWGACIAQAQVKTAVDLIGQKKLSLASVDVPWRKQLTNQCNPPGYSELMMYDHQRGSNSIKFVRLESLPGMLRSPGSCCIVGVLTGE